MKKLLALILSISMLIMCAPGLSLVASAESVAFDGGTGTSKSPYLISTAEQFKDVFDISGTQQDLVTNKNIYFKQTADIVLETFQNLGNSVALKCNYDGSGYSITINSYVNAGDSTYGGLFGTFGGELKNLTLEKGATITGKSYVGGFVGFSNSGKFINCVNKTDVTGNAYVGGIAGTLQNAIAVNCINEGAISSSSSSAGGITGYLYGANSGGAFINYCVNYGSVTGISTKNAQYNLGGIAGVMGTADKTVQATIENSINAGTVTPPAVGGTTGAILGRIPADVTIGSDGLPASLIISDCINAGELVDGSGLIIGTCETPKNAGDLVISINNFYDIANPEVPLYAEGAAPYLTYTGTGLVLAVNGATPETIINAYTSNEKYETGADAGYGYPNFVKATRTLNIKGVEYTIDNIAYDSAIGGEKKIPDPDGSVFYPYLIATPEDFLNIFGEDGEENDKLTGANYFRQTEDIVIEEYTPALAIFDGIYDGNGKSITIEKYTANTEANANQGLVSTLSGTIKNLTVKGKIGNIKVSNVGSIAGKTATGALISNCVNEAEVTGVTYVGGFVGETVNVTIENSVNKANVIGKNMYIGGFVGNARGTIEIENCGNYGLVRCLETGGRWFSGGFIGRLQGTANISKSFNAGDLTVGRHTTKQYSAGTFVGANVGSSPVTLTITDCFNTGKISSVYGGATAELHKNNGIVVGYFESLDNQSQDSLNVTITNFYDIANPNVQLLPPTSDGFVISTTNMLGLNDTVTKEAILDAFAANTVFEVKEGYDYPNFKLTDDVTVSYNPALKIAAADLSVTTGTERFLSSSLAEEEVVRTSDTNEVITTGFGVVYAKFTGISTLEGVEYGVFITKDYSKSGSKLNETTATEIAHGTRCYTVDGVSSFGMLIYGENMVPNDRYYIRPFVKYAGQYYYGSPTNFYFPKAK